MDIREKVIKRIFDTKGENGMWKVLPENHKYYPDYLHYVPNFKGTLWTLILLADLGLERNDSRIKEPLNEIQNHFFDSEHGIFSLKEDHFPIPCLNGNMIYLDCYFNKKLSLKSRQALDFFYKYQRFDDGTYETEPNKYCSNKSCYGKHSCYWGIVKLFKGLSFIPLQLRTKKIKEILKKCIDFILLHKVCFSSHKPDKLMIQKLDLLSFPNMYKSDFLEILWLLKREKVQSDQLKPALELLKEKQQKDGYWYLEKKVHNMVTSIGEKHKPNIFITKRANEVLNYYS